MTAVRERSSAEDPATEVRPPRRALTPTGALTSWTLAAGSLLLAWFVFYALVVSALQYSHDQSRLYSKFRQQLAEQTAPLGGVISPDAPVALMSMKSAGLHNVVIVEGTAASDLANGPGHLRDTPLPGQAGIAVVYGRSALFGGPFQHLARAEPGDPITFTTGQGEVTYRVDDVRRVGEPYPPPLAPGAGRLTLVTASASGWRSGWAPSAQLYVDASLVGRTMPTPGGRLASVPAAEQAMKGDASSLYLLVLWLPALLLGLLGTVWAYCRWSRRQAWLVGVPVVLAALWGVSQTAVQLLPNLM